MLSIILAGGKGTRIVEETKLIPKPMIKIGNKPILIHIMNIYKRFGVKKFLICAGYKHNYIRQYFKNKEIKIIKQNKNYLKLVWRKFNCEIEILNTGLNTSTGGRILNSKKYILKHGLNFFFVTYGDGVGNINIKKLLKLHLKNKRTATVTAVKPPPRFGVINIKKNNLAFFSEKIDNNKVLINGGFFIFNNEIFKYLKKKNDSLEKNILEKLSKKKKLTAYVHRNFWHPMDTLRDKLFLVKLWKNNKNLW